MAVLIDGRDARRPCGHHGPLCTNVPMQFANAAFNQSHLDARHFLRHGKIADRHLARPNSSLDALMRVGERIFERRLSARICFRREGSVGLGGIESLVNRPVLCLLNSGVSVAAHISRWLCCRNRLQGLPLRPVPPIPLQEPPAAEFIADPAPLCGLQLHDSLVANLGSRAQGDIVSVLRPDDPELS
jgi:hypothetical protein